MTFRHGLTLGIAGLLLLTACGDTTPADEIGSASTEGSGGAAPGGGGAAGVEAGGVGGVGSTGDSSGPSGAGRPPVTGRGGTPATGGCAPGGVTLPSTNGSAGTGAVASPTCPVDDTGSATTTLEELCSTFRCPATPQELLSGLACESPATPGDSIVLTSGCGVQTVEFLGHGVTYSATFTQGQAGPDSLRVRQDSPFGSCAALGYVAGTEPPPCDDETRLGCRRTDEAAGAYAGCRSAGEPGCSICCTQAVCGTGCTMASAISGAGRYDSFYSQQDLCSCECQPCAVCTTELEHQLRTLPEKPECECPAAPTGAGGTTSTCGAAGAGGMAGQGPASECGDHCGYRAWLATQCPGLLP